MQNKIVVLDSLLNTIAANSPLFHNEPSGEKSNQVSGQLFKVLHPLPSIPVQNGEYLLIEAYALSPQLKSLKVYFDGQEIAELYPPYMFYSFNLDSHEKIAAIKLTAIADNVRESYSTTLTVIHSAISPGRPRTILNRDSIQVVEGHLYGADKGILIRLNKSAIQTRKDVHLHVNNTTLAELIIHNSHHLSQSCRRKPALNEREQQSHTTKNITIGDTLLTTAKPHLVDIKDNDSHQRLTVIPENLSSLLNEIITLYQGLPKRHVKQLYNINSSTMNHEDFFKPINNTVVKKNGRERKSIMLCQPPYTHSISVRKQFHRKNRKH